MFVATDVQGNCYVSSTVQRTIEKYSPEGQKLYTVRGLQRPEAIAVDEDGNLYVVDFNQIKILRARYPREGGTGGSAAPASGRGGGL